MINVTRLNTQDLFSYANLDLNLVDRGLVLVDGINGQGKSNIFESLYWTLYGKTSKKLKSKDDVIREGLDHEPIKGKTYGYVELDKDGLKIEVWRHRSHKKFSNKLLVFLDGQDRTLSTDDETQGLLSGILGYDHETFLNAVLFPQCGAQFIGLGDAAQKSILDRIFHIERFSEAQARVKEELKGIRETLLTAVSAHQVLKAQFDNLDQDHKILTKQQDEWMVRTAGDLQRANAQLQALVAAMPQIDQYLIDQIEDHLQGISEAHFQTALLKLQECNRATAELKGKRSSYETEKKVMLRPTGGVLPPDLGVAAKPERYEEADELQSTATILQAQMAGAQTDIQRALGDLATVNNSLDKYTGQCPMCGHALNGEAEKRIIGNARDTQQALEIRIAGLRENHAQWTQDFAEIKGDLAAIVSYKAFAARSTLATAIAEIDEAIDGLGGAIREAEQEEREALNAYTALQSMRAEYDQLRDTLAVQQAAVANHQQAIDSAKYVVKEATERVSPYTDQVQRIESTRSSLSTKIATYDVVIDHHRRQQAVKEFWEQGFSNAGVKSLFYSHLLPSLTERTNEYLRILSDGKCTVEFISQLRLGSGEVRDKLDCRVTMSEGGGNYAKMSGGESRAIDLASLFAVGDLSSRRAGDGFNLRLLDEPFDSLDGYASERAVQCIQNLLLPECGTVLLMSHNDNLKALIRDRITVRKTAGISYLR